MLVLFSMEYCFNMAKYLNDGVCLNINSLHSCLHCIHFILLLHIHKWHSVTVFISMLSCQSLMNCTVFFNPSHRLRSLLDGGFLLGLVGGRPFTGRTGEQDQVVFGLRDLREVNESKLYECSVSVQQVRTVIMWGKLLGGMLVVRCHQHQGQAGEGLRLGDYFLKLWYQ